MSESVPPADVTSCQQELTCGSWVESVSFVELALPPGLLMGAIEYRIDGVEKRHMAPVVLDLDKGAVLVADIPIYSPRRECICAGDGPTCGIVRGTRNSLGQTGKSGAAGRIGIRAPSPRLCGSRSRGGVVQTKN